MIMNGGFEFDTRSRKQKLTEWVRFKKSNMQQSSSSSSSSSSLKETEDQQKLASLLQDMGMTSALTSSSTSGAGGGGKFRTKRRNNNNNNNNKNAEYYTLLAQQLADFLLPKLPSMGGIITLTDVFCLFNRARGSNLISPEDLLMAATILNDDLSDLQYQSTRDPKILLP